MAAIQRAAAAMQAGAAARRAGRRLPRGHQGPAKSVEAPAPLLHQQTGTGCEHDLFTFQERIVTRVMLAGRLC